jgi:hypothetical protein
MQGASWRDTSETERDMKMPQTSDDLEGPFMPSTLLRRLAAVAVAVGILCGSPAFAADTYQADLGPMPLNAATKLNIQGRGDATATLDGKVLEITGSFAGLSSPATVARLYVSPYIAVPGTAAFDLNVSQAISGTVSGRVVLAAGQMAAFRTGRLYVQIDSQGAPTGNLWGWLLPQHEDVAAGLPQQRPWFLPQLDTPRR